MVTFTLPAQLRPLAYANPKTIYNAMFDIALSTLNTFANNDRRLNGQPGACAILHTHSRQLDYHPHVHLIVPGCAMNMKRKQWQKLKGDYLFNGKLLAVVFRARMLEAINQLSLTMPNKVPEKWNTQCKYIGKGLPALKYLSRYLYRGVINEKDLLHFDHDQSMVTFGYVHSKSGKYRRRTLPLVDFLWRIMMQVLPKGFRRVRDYGLMHGNAKSRLVLLQAMLRVQTSPVAPRTIPVYVCTACHTAMRLIRFIEPGRYQPH